MLFFHLYYDINYIFTPQSFLLPPLLAEAWQVSIATVFIVVSGFVSLFSRSNLQRGIKCFLAGMAVTVALYLFSRQLIVFGILHFLGVAMIIAHFVRPLFENLNAKISALVCVLLFVVTYTAENGYLWFGFFKIPLPKFLYTTNILAPLGFYTPTFASADYYPLVPWMFLFFAGMFLGYAYSRNSYRVFADRYLPNIPLLAATGRNAFVIYLVHQPVTYLILVVFFKLFSVFL